MRPNETECRVVSGKSAHWGKGVIMHQQMRVNFNKEIMYGLMGSSHLTIGGNCKTYETVRPIYLESGRIHDILRKLKKSQRLEILMLILNSLIFQTICRKIS